MKKLIAMILSLALVLCCGLAYAEDKPIIGIIQQMDHVALNAARDGFIQALKDNGFVDGENIVLDIQNGQGDQSNLSTIADRFVAEDADLVLAIATTAATTMAGKTADIPILGTAITDYEEPKLVKSNEEPGWNISGTSDMNPVSAQIDLLKTLVPDCETVGVLYTSGEMNSVLQAKMAKEAIEEKGMKYVEVTLTNTNDVQQAVQKIVGMCDAIYLPTDNVLASSMPIVYGVSVENKVPVICGESGMVDSGGLATLGISYSELGYQTGLMAVEILGGADISKMPVKFITEGFEYSINKTVADELGLEIPEDLLPYAFEMSK